MPDLRITTGQPVVDMPLDAVTQKFAILAVSGRGKTYTASVMTEEMIEAGQPVCVIDPTGAWWGLRSSADGKKDGYPVTILGGKHGDLPLEPTAGRVIADMLVESPFPLVLDLSLFDSKADEIRFMTDFLTRLYRKNTEPLHLMIDEADEFAPQQAFPEGKRLLGAMEQIVRRGRLKGLGVTLITQRPAVLNKNVLSQIETLILLGMTGANDLQAIDSWVGKHARTGQAVDIKASLPGLKIGTAWIWSPAWLEITKKVRIRQRRTFDSSATPKVGQRRIEPKVMAEVDLKALGEQIAATVERAEAEDPKHLNKVIRDQKAALARLEAELRALRAAPAPEPEYVPVTVSALDEDDRMVLVEMAQTLDKILAGQGSGSTGPQILPERGASNKGAISSAPAAPATKSPMGSPRPISQPVANGNNVTMAKAERLILIALAQQGHLTNVQIAKITGYRHTSGGFKNALSSLRSNGWIESERGGASHITESGLEMLGPYDPLPTGSDLFEWWLAKGDPIGLAERTILMALKDCYPSFVSNVELAEKTGYSPTSGGFKNAMSNLRTLGLASGSGGLMLSEELVG